MMFYLFGILFFICHFVNNIMYIWFLLMNSWIDGLKVQIFRWNIIKMSLSWLVGLTQGISRSWQGFLLRKTKLILKFILYGNGLKIAKTVWKKRWKFGEITLPIVKAYLWAIKVVWYCGGQKIDQWNKNRETDLHKYDQLIWYTEAKATPWERKCERGSLSIHSARVIGHP